MKKRILLLITLSVSICARFYSQAIFPDANSVGNYLSGSWKWDKSCGGLAGICNTPTTSGYSPASIVFSKINGFPDSLAYSTYTNGNLIVSSGSKITYTTSLMGTTWNLEKISFNTGFSMRVVINVAKPDSVWFFEDCNDCFTRAYSRNKTTGIDETINKTLRVDIFPNPVKDNFKIKIDDNIEIMETFIYNALGQGFEVNLDRDRKINTSGLFPGIYILSLKTDKGSRRLKFIKE